MTVVHFTIGLCLLKRDSYLAFKSATIWVNVLNNLRNKFQQIY